MRLLRAIEVFFRWLRAIVFGIELWTLMTTGFELFSQLKDRMDEYSIEIRTVQP
jgi:hypothetical protein